VTAEAGLRKGLARIIVRFGAIRDQFAPQFRIEAAVLPFVEQVTQWFGSDD